MSKLTAQQQSALASAAMACRRGGLQKHDRRYWSARDTVFNDVYLNWIIASLADLGYLRLSAGGTCAHITERGRKALESAEALLP